MILSIESSCDDSSIALTEINSTKVIMHKKISQEFFHKEYGGVVPELASRLHIEYLPQLLNEFKPYFNRCKAIAVTITPGLSVSLNIGITMAKSLSIALDIPLIAINHLQGHIYSLFIEKNEIVNHTSILLSGGHTQIMKFNGYNKIKLISKTLDDSIGEGFDKVAKMLNYSYPGGSKIEELAKRGIDKYNFTVPMSNSPLLDFSYSGLKNAVRIEIEKSNNLKDDECNIAKSFVVCATKHLTMKCRKYFKKDRPKYISVVGGVSANEYIKDELQKLADEFRAELLYPELKYCSDNAAMIGRCAIDAYKNKDFTTHKELEEKKQYITLT